ncbi:hypothetical protein Hanom_Chr11g01014551 [Helianthus anomalus]
MVETWWIRGWYFLYINVSVILPNFRTTCHVKFDVLQLTGVVCLMVRMLNNLCYEKHD